MLPQAMKDLGAQVKIVSSPGEADPGVRDGLKEKQIEVIDFPRPERRGPRSLWESAKFLSGVLRNSGIDIVHVFGFAHAVRCWLAQRFLDKDKRALIVVQLDALRHGKPEEWLSRIIASYVFNRIRCVVCTLSSIEKEKMERSGVNRENLFMVPFFIDPNEFLQKFEKHDIGIFRFDNVLTGRTVITYLANFIRRKGHADLLRAARIVVQKHPRCMFILAGEGPILDQIRRQTLQFGLSDHVLFPGRLSIQQIPALLNLSHIGVVASHSETFGSAIIEPLLADRPVVTTDVGFAADLQSAGGVLMVPKHHPRALAEALVNLIENPQLRNEIARRGKQFVLENCDISKVSQKYLDIYKSYLA
jgi:glycosyltransferase involved in cell wall biosynthesis